MAFLVHKSNNRFLSVIIIFLSIISSAFLLLLFFSILGWTVELTYDFDVYFVKQKFLPTVIRLAIIVGIMFGIKRIKLPHKIYAVISICYLLLTICFVLVMALWPTYDQFYMSSIASQMMDGDYNEFLPYGYIDLFPFQYGFVKYVYYVFSVFGRYNYFAIQILNAFYLFVLIQYFVKIMYEYGSLEMTASYRVGLLMMFFLPLALYTTYIYGTILAVMLSTISIYYLLGILNKKSNIVINIFVVIISNAFAIIIKNNSLIIMIAEVCLIFVYMIYDFRGITLIRHIALITLMIAGVFLLSTFVNNSLYKHTVSNNIGTPKASWIAMGLQEGGPAEGWYNSYNRDVYWNNECNVAVATELSKKAIDNSVDYFIKNPHYALSFFKRKMISQWSNPSFEALNLYQQSKINNPNNKNRYSILKKLFLWNSQYKSLDQTHVFLNEYLKIFELAIILGSFVFMVQGKLNKSNCIFIIIFIGGILFHTIWEASPQYMLPYFIMLIPYGSEGLSNVSIFDIRKCFKRNKKVANN